MYVPCSDDIKGSQIPSQPLIETLHFLTVGTGLVSHKFGPRVAASVDDFKNTKRSLEPALIQPFEELAKMDIHRLAVWFVD